MDDDETPSMGWHADPGLAFELASHDAVLRDLFMQTSLPQALVDREGRFVMANQAYRDLVGYSDVDLFDQTLETITEPSEIAAQRAALKTLRAGRRQLTYLSSRLRRGDGGTVNCRVALAVVRDDTGTVRFVHQAVERIRMPAGGSTSDAPVIVPPSAAAAAQLERVLNMTTTGQVQVVLLRLEGLEDIAAVLGWRGVDSAQAQIVSRLARTSGMGVKSIVPIGATELLVLADAADIMEMTSVMQSALRGPVGLGGVRLPINLKIGLTTGGTGDDPEVLLRQARIALNQALRSSAPEVRYEPELDARALQDFALSLEIAHALVSEDFALHYQPKYDLAQLELVGVEALLRWDHPDRGLVPPDRVIRLAETSGLIAPLTCWVIDTAAAQAAAWRDAGTPTRIAVNIAPSMLGNPVLPLRLSQAITRHNLPASTLELEITETALASEPYAVTAVQKLTELGFPVHIDDFGTGYSSLVSIRSLPLSAIKIDRAFVTNLVDDTRDRAVVAAVVEIAHQLGSRVIAEGVEDEITLDLLRILGCDMAQGFFLGRPAPPDALGEHLSNVREPG